MLIQHCGEQHHFVGKCRFHLATFIDDIVVSTVGAFWSQVGDDLRTIGLDRYYETMVFRTDNEWSTKLCGEVGEYAHPGIVDFGDDIGPDHLPFGYNTSDAATRGHQMHVEYWLSQGVSPDNRQ